MVKGVNRTVIEINDTGNKYFSRVVFFINPEYSFLPPGKLENRAKEYLGTLDKNDFAVPHTRKKKKRSSRPLAATLILSAAAIVTALTLVLILI